MDELLLEFKSESLKLIDSLDELLDQAEMGLDCRACLEQYGQMVDRIYGGAKSLEMTSEVGNMHVSLVGNFAQLCKCLGYKGSQITDNETFYIIVVALLQDATEVMADVLNHLGDKEEFIFSKRVQSTFLERMKWAADHFDENIRGTLAIDSEADQKEKAIQESLQGAGLNELLKQILKQH